MTSALDEAAGEIAMEVTIIIGVWSLSERNPRHYYNVNNNRKSC